MTETKINYARGTTDSAYGPLGRAFDITPSVDALGTITRVVTVSDGDATITGYLEHDLEIFTTHPLKAGMFYPLKWRIITAVSAGTIKGYA